MARVTITRPATIFVTGCGAVAHPATTATKRSPITETNDRVREGELCSPELIAGGFGNPVRVPITAGCFRVFLVDSSRACCRAWPARGTAWRASRAGE